jgi:hypothetical protein
MRLIRMSAAAGVAALAFAGCGGGDSNKSLSYSEFTAEANEVCKGANDEIEALSRDLTGKAKNDAPILDEIVPKQEAAINDFKELEPPEELKPSFDQFNSISDQQVAAAKEAQAAATGGDQAAYQEAIQKLEPLSKQSDEAASKLGAEECLGD